MEQAKPIKTKVVIDEVKVDKSRYVIKATPTDSDKQSTFSFFQTKSDGTNSKAYEGFQELKPTVGTVVEFFYSEKPNDKYPDYPYKNIAYFVTDGKTMEENNAVRPPKQPVQAYQDETGGIPLEQRITELEERMTRLELKDEGAVNTVDGIPF